MTTEPNDFWHREVLTPAQHAVLERCRAIFVGQDAFLAGGMALALRFGHRRSRDLDWFTLNGGPFTRKLQASP